MNMSQFPITYHRIRVSCMAVVRAWPTCKVPVTFGGGNVITKVPSGLGFPSAANWGEKKPCASHQSYQDDSIAMGLYPAAISCERSTRFQHFMCHNDCVI